MEIFVEYSWEIFVEILVEIIGHYLRATHDRKSYPKPGPEPGIWRMLTTALNPAPIAAHK